MKARVMEQLGSSGSHGASAVLTKVQGKANIKNEKCSLATSRRAAMVTATTSPNFSEEVDNQQVGACLERIQSLVPFTDKNKTLSNLDIITSAIFYIRDLQETLGFAESDSTLNSEDNLDLISPLTTCMATEQCSETSAFSTNCSIDSPPPPSTVPQSPTTAHRTSSSPPALVTSGGDSASPRSTIIRQRHPLSVIPSPNTHSASAANCHGYWISQKTLPSCRI